MQQHRSCQRLGFYRGASLHQGIQLPDELAGLGAGHLQQLFCPGSKLGRAAARRSLKQLSRGLTGGFKNNGPFVQQFHIRRF
ncbi:hypothetical protein D3C75_1016710 [compost metagenome]